MRIVKLAGLVRDGIEGGIGMATGSGGGARVTGCCSVAGRSLGDARCATKK